MSCIIKLDNYQGRYCAGDVILGKVICSFTKLEDIKGIVLKLKGKEKNEWIENPGTTKSTTTVRGSNTFLHVINTLHKGGKIGPDRFEYPFTIQLPSGIPSTYKGRYGGIFFSLKVVVERPFTSDYTDTKAITVFSPINFNLIRNQLQFKRVHHCIEKTLSSSSGSGTITMGVDLEKNAFVVGEVANVRVLVSNMSTQSIMSVNVELGMEVTSMVVNWNGTKSKSSYKRFASKSDLGMGAHRWKTYNFTLKIPKSARVPNFSLCKLFSTRTVLKVTAPIERCHEGMVIEYNVTLGDIPLHDPSVPAEQPSHPSSSRPTNPVMPSNQPTQNPSLDPNGYAALKRVDDGSSATLPENRVSASAAFGRELSGYESVVEEEAPPSYNEAMGVNATAK